MINKNKLAIILATGFGTGYSPFASGTVGSIVAFPLVALIGSVSFTGQVIIMTILFFLSVPVSSYAEDYFNEKDSGKIVIDEIIGMGFTFIGIALTWKSALTGFLLFRLFDIWKFQPMDKLQDLPKGWGIMADDLVAGIFANILMQIIL